MERLYLYAACGNDPKQGDLELGVLETGVREPDDQATEPILPTMALDFTCAARGTPHCERMRDGLDVDLQETRRGWNSSASRTATARNSSRVIRAIRAGSAVVRPGCSGGTAFPGECEKFVIPFYVMTRDIRRDSPEEALP